MIKNLILIGLFVLPLFVMHGYSFRYPREILALGLALAIAMYGIYEGLIQCEFDNVWILAFIGWVFISLLFIPQIKGLEFGSQNVNGLWNIKSLFYISIYAITFFVISNLNISDDFIMKSCYAILIPSVITAIIVIGQYFGIENFFRNPIGATEQEQHLVAVTNYKLGGLMGQPTLCSAYLAMTLPIALYLRKHFVSAIIILSIILIKSDVATIAMISSFAFLLCFSNWKRLGVLAIGVFLIVIVGLCFKYQIQDSGRFGVWLQIWKDMTTPFLVPNGLTYFFTGFGIGSFPYFFPFIHSGGWEQAHNEYLQLFYGAGAIGLSILLFGIYKVFKSIWDNFEDYEIRYLSSSLCAICICAFGTFVWQLGVFQFYSVVILGIIYNLKRRIVL